MTLKTFQALATKGWMMYYALAISLIGGVDGTAIRSLVSKCVEPDEYGKVFTLSSVFSTVASLIGGTITPLLYKGTVDNFPGATYLYDAANDLINIIMMCGIYWVIFSHEKIFGPIGKGQGPVEEDEKKLVEDNDMIDDPTDFNEIS